jgi:dienelactone hydrolase
MFACASPSAAQVADGPDNPKMLPPAPLNVRELRLPGDPDRPVTLVVTLYVPPGPGPFPLAVVNHAAANGRSPADTPRHRYSYLAYYFMSRGYAVALPMIRGYAGSGGQQANHGCDFSELALENGRDIAGVITALAPFAQVDTNRVVIAGEGLGGWNTLGAAALNPPGVRGAIDFFGLFGSSGCGPIQGGALAGFTDGARRLGAATTTTPSLWFFGDGDKDMPADLWRPMFKAYTAQGGQAELVDVGTGMSAGQLALIESFRFWVPRVDAFLAKIGMPAQNIYPEYMPLPWPKPSGFAPLEDAAAIPNASAGSQDLYRKFLGARWPRVFAVAPGGQSVLAAGFFDPLAAALGECRAHQLACTPYAVDNDVVYRPEASAPAPLTPVPPASHFAALQDLNAVPFLAAKGRAAYANFLTQPLPRAFVVAPDGQSATTQGGTDPLGRALALCQSHGLDCRPYAVDNQVVWVSGQVPAQAPRPPASHFAAISDVMAVPYLSEKGRAAYAHFLSVQPPRAFVIAPGGASVAAQGGYDPLSRALATCRRAGLECAPYAVDKDVVWQGK